MIQFILILSCLYTQQINCNGVETDFNVDNTRSTTKPKDDDFVNSERSAFKYTEENESTSAVKEFNRKIKRETIGDTLEETRSDVLINNREVSDFNLQFNPQLSDFKQEKAEQSPYSVILLMNTGTGIVSCTGTLLTLQWVVTAASCLLKASFYEFIIYAGGNDHDELLNNALAKGSQVRNSKEYHYHPSYYKVGFFKYFYNVAVVKADQAFELSETVAPIQLSTSHVSFTQSTKCKITSFGRVDLPTTSKNYFRKTQHLTVETPCLCFDEENAFYWICPRNNQPLSVCKGDIGAGLICDGKMKAFLSEVIPARDARTCDMAVPEYYDCLRVNNTINVFQGTCPYLKFINQYVKLFSQRQIAKSCDLEPQYRSVSETTMKTTDSRASIGYCSTILNVFLVLVLICFTY